MAKLNTEKLRNDLKEESLGAFFGGGFGGGLMEYSDIERASDEKLVDMARRNGINLSKYTK